MLRSFFLAARALLAALLLPNASAQMPLLDPDLSSLAKPYHGGLVLAADVVPGWYYVSGAQVLGGVRTCGGPVSRVSAAGIIDTSWCMDEWPRADTYRIRGLQVLPSGVLLVRTWQDWRVARKNAQGRFVIQGIPGIDLENNDQATILVQGLDNQFYVLVNKGNHRKELRRLRLDATIDPSWQLTLAEANPQTLIGGLPNANDQTLISAIGIGQHGEVTYLETLPATPTRQQSTTLVRQDARGRVLWRTPFNNYSLRQQELMIDRQGRTYLRANNSAVMRLAPNGQPDPTWPPSSLGTGEEFLYWDYVEAGALVNNVLWLVRRLPGKSHEFIRYNTDLDQISWRQESDISYTGFGYWVNVNDKALFILIDTKLHALRDIQSHTPSLKLEPLFDLGLTFTKNDRPHLLRWGSGWLALGDLHHYFEGHHLRSSALRFDPQKRLLVTWQPNFRPLSIDGLGNFIFPHPLFTAPPIVDRAGGLIVSGHFDMEDVSRLVRFHADGSLDRTWPMRPNNYVVGIGRGSDGSLFFSGPFTQVNNSPRQGHARLDVNGLLDPDWGSSAWEQQLRARGIEIDRYSRNATFLDLGDGRVLMISHLWMRTGIFGQGEPRVFKTFISRIPYGPRTQNESAFSLTPPGGFSGLIKLYRNDSGHWFQLREILGVGRFRFERVDPDTLNPVLPWRAWEEPELDVAGMDARYIYLVNVEGTFRVDALTGELDPNWKPVGLRIESIVPGNSPEEPALAWGRFGSSTDYRLFALQHTSRSPRERSVVEYYAPQSDRYFITGRAEEQASLDAMPSHFRRTGMRFQALEAEVSLSQSAWQPVCRFYASRERGGSNTHFYGMPRDCQLLHARTRFAYEGVDFAVQPPASPTSCPAEAPQPVYRLFNGRVATNDGNHRYVVSTARRHEMLARGWQDEGLVFCVSSVVDAAPLSP